MASEADPYERVVNLMEDALELLDALGASEAATLLDHAICVVPTLGDFIRERRGVNVRTNFDALDDIDKVQAG